MIVIKIALIIIIVLVLLLGLKLTVSFHISQENGKVTGKITFSMLFKVIHYSISVPEIGIDDETASVVYEEYGEGAGPEAFKKDKLTFLRILERIRSFKRFLQDVAGLYDIVRTFLSKVTVSQLNWHTEIGTGDAAQTGQISGLMWSLKGALTGICAHFTVMKHKPHLKVIPSFDQIKIATSFQCMVSFRIGYAIHAGIKVLKHSRKMRREQRGLLHYQ